MPREVRDRLRQAFEGTEGVLRRRLAEVLGRSLTVEDHAVDWLIPASSDPDPRVRRPLLRALGRIGGREAELRLMEVWNASNGNLPELRAVARALTDLGTDAARDALASPPSADPEVCRLCAEGRLRLERGSVRKEPGGFVVERQGNSSEVVFHSRRGLEAELVEELLEIDASLCPKILGPGRVGAHSNGDLRTLQRARLALFFGFPLGSVDATPDPLDAVAELLTAERVRALMRAWYDGPLRFRCEWHGLGRQRSANLRLAQKVRRRWPELVNDPVSAPWEVRITTGQRQLHIELAARGLVDPRFQYRRASVPAASHPTIAAALARLGGARADDVVWDPFVGSGTELAERAHLGPWRLLIGTDQAAAALQAARANLEGLPNLELYQADALSYRPRLSPTLVLTNPPLGRRCPTDVHRLTRSVLERCAELLASGGRLAWITPDTRILPDSLKVIRWIDVDLGGFGGQLQLVTRR